MEQQELQELQEQREQGAAGRPSSLRCQQSLRRVGKPYWTIKPNKIKAKCVLYIYFFTFLLLVGVAVGSLTNVCAPCGSSMDVTRLLLLRQTYIIIKVLVSGQGVATPPRKGLKENARN